MRSSGLIILEAHGLSPFHSHLVRDIWCLRIWHGRWHIVTDSLAGIVMLICSLQWQTDRAVHTSTVFPMRYDLARGSTMCHWKEYKTKKYI